MKKLFCLIALLSIGNICFAEYPIYKESGGLYIQNGNTTIAPNGDMHFTYGNTTITPDKTYYNYGNTSFGSDGSMQIRDKDFIYEYNDNNLRPYYQR